MKKMDSINAFLFAEHFYLRKDKSQSMQIPFRDATPRRVFFIDHSVILICWQENIYKIWMFLFTERLHQLVLYFTWLILCNGFTWFNFSDIIFRACNICKNIIYTFTVCVEISNNFSNYRGFVFHNIISFNGYIS